jgi:RHS repeat-associated protein
LGYFQGYLPYPNQIACDQVWIQVTYFTPASLTANAPTVPEESATMAGQWNSANLADNVSLTQGNYYWIAYNSDTAGVVSDNTSSSGGNRRVLSSSYGTYSFPSIYDGTGFNSDNVSDMVAGCGLGGSPVIAANPPSFSVSGMPGRSDPVSQSMIISNGAVGSFSWSANKTASWLNLSSSNGTGGTSLTVSENLTGLTAGVYNDNVTITVAGASNSPLTVPVTLTVTSGGGSSFVYDGDGRRIRKTENGQTTLYINKYFEKTLLADNTTYCSTYYYMGSRLIAMRKGNNNPMYVHQDHLTGTSLMTDSNGVQVGATMKYYPFGAARSGYLPSDIKFTGQRLDDSGLYYYGARYYDPQIGRFISADYTVQITPGTNQVTEALVVDIVPFVISQTASGKSVPMVLKASPPESSQELNRYSYTLNNPLSYKDSTGRGAELTLAALTGLAIAAALAFYLAIVIAPQIIAAAKNHRSTDSDDHKGGAPNAPDVQFPGNDPSKSPGEGFEWQGNNKTPGSREGSWHNEGTKETWHPDLNNEKEGPHWDYRDKDGNWWRVDPDGKVTPKNGPKTEKGGGGDKPDDPTTPQNPDPEGHNPSSNDAGPSNGAPPSGVDPGPPDPDDPGVVLC